MVIEQKLNLKRQRNTIIMSDAKRPKLNENSQMQSSIKLEEIIRTRKP